MAVMDESLDDLLNAYRFSEAEGLIAGMADPERTTQLKRLKLAKLACEPAARRRSSAIQTAARKHDFESLLAIEADPLTEPLLAVLPPELQSGAQIQLENAHAWKTRRYDSNRSRLQEAQEALEAFDPTLARSLVSNIDSRYLSETDLETRDRLLIDVEARIMEMEAFNAAALQVDEETNPRRKRWWKRS